MCVEKKEALSYVGDSSTATHCASDHGKDAPTRWSKRQLVTQASATFVKYDKTSVITLHNAGVQLSHTGANQTSHTCKKNKKKSKTQSAAGFSAVSRASAGRLSSAAASSPNPPM